jgi:membrane-associated protease RseP (regulator of RpoE activity)
LAWSTKVLAVEAPPGLILPEGGPKPGERVLAVDGVPVPTPATGQAAERLLLPKLGQEVVITVAADGQPSRDINLRYAGNSGAADTALGLPVRVREVMAGMPAQGLLRPGDIVVSVEGDAVCGVQHLSALVARHGAQVDPAGGVLGKPVRLAIIRDNAAQTISVGTDARYGRPMLGAVLEPVLTGPLPVLAPALDGQPSAAESASARLKPGDSLVSYRQDLTTGVLTLRVVEGGERQIIIAPGSETTLALGIGSKLTGVRVVANATVEGDPTGSPEPGVLTVASTDGSPRAIDLRALSASSAFLAAVQPGDWLLGAARSSEGVLGWAILRGASASAPRQAVLTPRVMGPPIRFDLEESPYQLSSPLEAFSIANSAAYGMIVRSFQLIPRFFTSAERGGVDASKSLQGPIGIFDELRLRAERFGLDSWLKLVALIGLNLVLINLLPIPVTDGGQLVLLAIETALGRPVPNWVKDGLLWMGLGLVLSLMLFVTWLDISRRI